MLGRWLLLSPLLVNLAGCNSAEEKIVDLSAGVFLVFVVLVLVKYASPKMLRMPIFTRFICLIERHSVVIVGLLYACAVLLIAGGFFMAGIHRIHVFSGFVVFAIAVHLRSLVNSNTEENRKRSVEIISLGFGILFTLTSLWFFGAELFRGL
ncbi:MAG: hypothetical protein V7754_16115 [Halioglobus sp.]